jgi:hypothetical protein
MRHALGFGVLLLLMATGEGRAAGNQPFCLQGLWTPTGSMSAQRCAHAAVLLRSGKVLVAGGVGSSGENGTAELYDPVTGTWSPTGAMSRPRSGHTATLLPTGKVLVAGGCCSLSSAELYDPDTGQWTATGAMLDDRYLHTATLLPTGKVLVVGGQSPSAVPLASAELYDPDTGQWSPTGSMSTPRLSHTTTLLPSGKVLAVGGLGLGPGPVPGPGTFLASAELYDPAAGTWTPAASMLAARAGHTATLLLSGAVLVAGGEAQVPFIDALVEAELYDPASGTWRRTRSLFVGRTGHTATRLPSGRVLVVGGTAFFVPFPFTVLSDTELFDPESETWSDAGCLVEARDCHTATLLLSGAVLIAGGEVISERFTYLSSAELYGIVVSPAQITLMPGANQTFTARGGSGFDYVWSFKQNNSEGTLTAAGLYQAGPVGGVTDVLQVVDSFENSATATVNVTQQATTVSATSPQAQSVGCATSGGTALPSLAGAILVLLGWISHSRRARRTE